MKMIPTTKQKVNKMKKAIILLALLIIGCGVLDQNVSLVKDGFILQYPDKTVGEAVSSFVGKPHWTSIIADDGSGTYVNITGEISYDDQPIKMLLQFAIDEQNKTFELYALEFNGLPQDENIMSLLITSKYESMENEYNEEGDSDYYSRDDLREALSYKSFEEVKDILGKPHQTQDLGGLGVWYYEQISYDPVSETVDMMMQIMFSTNGLVESISFY
jgi:phage pi2 protein 07